MLKRLKHWLDSLNPERVAKFRERISLFGGVSMLVSIGIAIFIRLCHEDWKKPWGYILVGCWALIPPLWFFVEWVFLRQHIKEKDGGKDDLKNTQDLARNIWIALVVVLAAILDIKWPTE